MIAGRATSTILAGLDELEREVGEDTGAAIGEIVQRTAGPFAVAVVGRLKAGKSTLVNALLGHPAAATAVAECTTVVSRFRRGVSDLVVVHRTDGTRSRLPLDRMLMPPIDDPGHGIEHVEVTLTSLRLDGLELIDTPGLASLTGSTSERTEELLDLASQRASADADAIVYLFNGIARNDDVEVLRHFVRSTGGRSVAGVVGVLNKADQVTGGLAAARDHAARLAEQLADVVSTVVPTVALAAQATRCGFVDTGLLDVCRRLAGHPSEERARWWRDRDLFALLPLDDVSSAERGRLTEVVGLRGAESMVEHLAGAPGDRAGAVAAVEAISGIGEIAAGLDRLSARRDALKSVHALTALERLAWAPTTPSPDGARLRRLLDDLRGDPALHVIEQLAALDMIAAEPGLVSDDERDELDALFGGPTQGAEVDGYRAAARWHAIAGSPVSPRRRHIAGVARQAYRAFYDDPARTS